MKSFANHEKNSATVRYGIRNHKHSHATKLAGSHCFNAGIVLCLTLSTIP